jgi:hypothetical protein
MCSTPGSSPTYNSEKPSPSSNSVSETSSILQPVRSDTSDSTPRNPETPSSTNGDFDELHGRLQGKTLFYEGNFVILYRRETSLKVYSRSGRGTSLLLACSSTLQHPRKRSFRVAAHGKRRTRYASPINGRLEQIRWYGLQADAAERSGLCKHRTGRRTLLWLTRSSSRHEWAKA